MGMKEGNSERVKESTSGVGNRATGDVNGNATEMTITDSGDTALEGTVDVSTEYGDNTPYAGESGIRCGNANGQAACLSE